MLAAQGAVRGGAGIVALAVPHELRHIAATSLPEVTLPTVFDKTDRSLFDGLVALKLLEKAETIKAKSVKQKKKSFVFIFFFHQNINNELNNNKRF